MISLQRVFLFRPIFIPLSIIQWVGYQYWLSRSKLTTTQSVIFNYLLFIHYLLFTYSLIHYLLFTYLLLFIYLLLLFIYYLLNRLQIGYSSVILVIHEWETSPSNPGHTSGSSTTADPTDKRRRPRSVYLPEDGLCSSENRQVLVLST